MGCGEPKLHSEVLHALFVARHFDTATHNNGHIRMLRIDGGKKDKTQVPQ